MIQRFADILKAFMENEAAKLAEFKIQHAPTIGAMYEGLSTKVLNSAIPPNLDLRVVSGFVTDAMGEMSGQLDCMLVRGAGEPIPYTTAYKWPIEDVLAVFEIKKNLTYEDLKDSFGHLRQVYDSYRKHLDQTGPDSPVEVRRAVKAFGQITGVHSTGRTDDVPADLQIIHYTLLIEQLSPVRIVWAYGGYKTQTGLRRAMIKLLRDGSDQQGAGEGLGVPCFPQLISSDGISLVKANGQPYRGQMQGEFWPFYFSSRTNPVWLMLELLWAKIANTFQVQMPFDDSVVEEVFYPFISAKRAESHGRIGWLYRYVDMKGIDGDAVTTKEWAPVEIDVEQFVVLTCVAEEGLVDMADVELVSWLRAHEHDDVEFAEDLIKTGFVARDGSRLRLTVSALHFAVTDDGKYLVSSNEDQMRDFVLKLAERKRESGLAKE